MSADRPETPGTGVTTALVEAFLAAAITSGATLRAFDNTARLEADDEQLRAGLAAVVPLIRAQVATELRTCQETAASLLANDDHPHECEREAGHRSPRHRCACGCEWWPMVEWERPVITPAVPSTSAAPVTYTATEGFYEPDEDPADVQGAFDAGEKGVTRRPDPIVGLIGNGTGTPLPPHDPDAPLELREHPGDEDGR